MRQFHRRRRRLRPPPLENPTPQLANNGVVYFENFEGGGAGWTADNGVWAIGTPTNVGPSACANGNKCAATVLDGNYPNGQDSHLISPPIVLPATGSGQSLHLRMSEWHGYTDGGYDYAQAQISTWNAATNSWSTWQNIGNAFGYGISPAWSASRDFDLSAYAGKKVRLGFFHHADGGTNGPGWYLDDITVNLQTPVFDGGFETGWGQWSADGDDVWQVGYPTSGPNACHGGYKCAATILNGNYLNSKDSRLISTEMQLPTVQAPNELRLRFWDWHVYTDGNYDYGQVQISAYIPQAQTWTAWQNLGNPVVGSSPQWLLNDLNVTAYAGQKVRLGFFHHVDGGSNGLGWYIDDISITGVATPYTVMQSIQIGDLNGNHTPEIATLAQANIDGSMQVLIRDSATAALLKTLNFGKAAGLSLAEVAADIDTNGKTNIAVLYRNPANGYAYVAIRDASTGAVISSINFGGGLLAQSVAVLNDIDANGTPEIAVSLLAPTTTAGAYRLDVRDALTGALVKKVTLP